MNKRILSLFLALTLLCGLLPQLGLTAHADTHSGYCGGEGDGSNLQWSFDDDTGVLTITGSGEMADFGRSWDVPWYAYRGTITAVNLPDGLTSIGWPAFSGCSALTSVTIPDSVTSISGFAFDGCSALTSVTIPDGVTSIGMAVFQNCTALTSVTIGNGVTNIGEAVFYNCTALTSVTITASVTSIGNSAFFHCYALTSVTIPDSVTSIGYSAFNGCSSLTSVTIPGSVTSINNYAFYGCSALTSVTIGNGVTSIGDSAFHGCSALTAFTVASNNPSYSSMDGVLFNKTKTELIQYPAAKSENSYTIPDSVTSIGDYAFYNCSALTSVTIPDGVTSIGGSAFYGCSSLTSVTIPDSVTSIGGAAFASCSALTSVVIPNSVTSIGGDAFASCSALTSVTIPNSVTSIGYGTFENCSALTSVTIGNGVTSIGRGAFSGTAYYNDETNWTDHILYLGNWVLEAKREITTADIRQGTRGIADSAFEDCNALTNVTIPDSVTIIGGAAFASCSALTSVVIPNSVTSIGEIAFSDCSALTSVTIPDSVTSIGWGAFRCCLALTSVSIPASVTSIGDYAFVYYSNEDTDKEERLAGFTIHGYEGTEAQRYAVENEFAFVSLQVVNPFEDVQESDFYFNPVLWAVENNVTSGRDATHFAPNETVKRSEAMLFFYAAKGRPEYSITKSPFKDVKKKHWFYDAVLWAVENKITSGTDATHFSPNKTCIRSEILQFLYAAMDKPEYTIENPYSDVKKKHWYYDGAIWAYEMGLERGSNGKFKAKTPCTRAYVVTYLYRFITGKELVK